MELKDLKNTKIYLSNKEEMEAFQEKVFKLGLAWGGGSQRMVIPLYSDMYIMVNDHLELSWGTGKIFFIEKRMPQIFLDEVLAIEEPKIEHSFKPFDKVLVRINKHCKWSANLFTEYVSGKYGTISGTFYEECIPYEGNEDLLGKC